MNKIGDLEYLIASYDPHIVTVTETWLHPDIRDNELLPPGYKIMRNDRESRGGGVAIIVKEDVECIRLQGIQNHESVWCNVMIDNALVLLGAIYRAPNKPASYLQNIKSYLDEQKPRNGRIILSGDFNLPGIDWESFIIGSQERAECDSLIDIAFSHDLSQIVQESTRTAGAAESILDLVFLGGCFDNYEIAIDKGISDHKLVFVQIKHDTVRTKIEELAVYVPNFSKADDTSIIDYLSCSFDHFSAEADVKVMWAKFKAIIFHCIDSFIPVTKRKTNKRNP